MKPDKSDSFTFHRDSELRTSNRSEGRLQNCRRRLQNNFDNDTVDSVSCNQMENQHNRSVMSVLSLNDTRRAIKNGAEKLSKTFYNVKMTFGTISQKFKTSTRRRQILEEGPVTPNCATPQTYSRALLGRTPTQLYSPFTIETPQTPKGTESLECDKENHLLPMTPPDSAKPLKTTWYRKRNLLDDIFH